MFACSSTNRITSPNKIVSPLHTRCTNVRRFAAGRLIASARLSSLSCSQSASIVVLTVEFVVKKRLDDEPSLLRGFCLQSHCRGGFFHRQAREISRFDKLNLFRLQR